MLPHPARQNGCPGRLKKPEKRCKIDFLASQESQSGTPRLTILPRKIDYFASQDRLSCIARQKKQACKAVRHGFEMLISGFPVVKIFHTHLLFPPWQGILAAAAKNVTTVSPGQTPVYMPARTALPSRLSVSPFAKNTKI